MGFDDEWAGWQSQHALNRVKDLEQQINNSPSVEEFSILEARVARLESAMRNILAEKGYNYDGS